MSDESRKGELGKGFGTAHRSRGGGGQQGVLHLRSDIASTLRRVFSAKSTERSVDRDVALAFVDPFVHRVAADLTRNPMFKRVFGRRPVEQSAEIAPDDECDGQRSHGMLFGREVAGACASFSRQLQVAPLPLEVVSGGSPTRLRLDRIRSPWPTADGTPADPLSFAVRGGWIELVAAGALDELFMVVLEGAVDVQWGLQVKSVAARKGEGIVCLSLRSSDRHCPALPSVLIRSTTGATGVLVGAAAVAPETSGNCIRPPGTVDPRAVANGNDVVSETFEAPFGPNALEWARRLPHLNETGYAHEAAVQQGDFTVRQPASTTNDVARQLEARVLLLSPNPLNRNLNLARHGDEELIIPLHGGVLCRYYDSTPAHSSSTTFAEIERFDPGAVPVGILATAQQKGGRLEPIIIAIKSEEPHGIAAAGDHPGVCLHVLRRRPRVRRVDAQAEEKAHSNVTPLRGRG